MELFQPQLLPKDAIIKILKERQLKEPNLEKLSKDELVNLFKKYAMPLHRRENRRNKTEQTNNDDCGNLDNDNSDNDKAIRIKPPLENGGDNSTTSNQHKRIKLSNSNNSVTTNGFTKKRLNDSEINDNDFSTTKRKKITYP